VTVVPEAGDYVVDGGLFFGEVAVRIAADAGATGHIYGFDPVDFHCEIACDNINRNAENSASMTVFRCGLSDKDATGDAVPLAALMPGFRVTSGVATRALDSLVRTGEVEAVDFIKLDIEGAELAALHGAEECLRRFRPKLAISLYHRPSDFFSIPLFLRSRLPDYDFYLDHYSIHSEETVLYGRPR